jgi:hypothetical protein
MSGIVILMNVLMNTAAVTSQIPAARMYPGELPIGVSLPALAMQVVWGSENKPLSGRGNKLLRRERVQVTVAAADITTAMALATLVRKTLRFRTDAVAGFTGVSVVPDADGPDASIPEPVIHLRMKDYMVTYHEVNQ